MSTSRLVSLSASSCRYLCKRKLTTFQFLNQQQAQPQPQLSQSQAHFQPAKPLKNGDAHKAIQYELTQRFNWIALHASLVEEAIQADKSLQSPDYFQVHSLFTVKDLFDARVHMGHKIGSLQSEMRPFIFGKRFDSLIFDLDITAFYLRQALNFVAHIAYRQGIIMFITRSPQSMHLVEKTAIEVGEYAHTKEWDGAVLTNSITKFNGITRLPDLIIFLNTLSTVLEQHRAIKDAAKMLIPTVGIVDSNCRPNLITYPVPGNDDSYPAVELYCKLFKEAILRGKNKRKLEESQKSEKESTKRKPESETH